MIRPVRDKLLIKNLDAEKEMEGNIYIPEHARQKSEMYEVIAIGDGDRDAQGNDVPFYAQPGDIILTASYGGVDINYEGMKYRIISNIDIMGVIEPDVCEANKTECEACS